MKNKTIIFDINLVTTIEYFHCLRNRLSSTCPQQNKTAIKIGTVYKKLFLSICLYPPNWLGLSKQIKEQSNLLKSLFSVCPLLVDR